MQDISSIEVFALGMLGGSLVELVRWYKLREAPEYPIYAKKIGYWIVTFLMVVAGGAVATLYGLDEHHPAALVNLGASTPAILGALAGRPLALAPLNRGTIGIGEKSFAGDRLTLPHANLLRKFIAFGN
jgi:hypothetical protein